MIPRGWQHIAAGMLVLAAAAVPVRAEPQPGRLALVLASAAYTGMPALPGCTLSGRAVADGLRQAGFDVAERTDPSNGALGAAFGALARRIAATPDAAVVIYFCGYATEFDGRVFVLPATAALDRASDVLTQGMAARSVTDAAFRGSRAGLAVLDLFPAPGASANGISQSVAARSLADGQFIAATVGADLAAAPTPLAQALVKELHPPAVAGTLLRNLRTALAGATAVSLVTAGEAGAPAALMPAPDRTAAVQEAKPDMPLAAATPPAPVRSTPPISGPPISGPPISGPPISGPPISGPPISGPPISGPPASATLTAFPEEAQYTGQDRQAVQAALLGLGYYAGPVDGLFGAGTHAAIRRYQHEIGADMTGVLAPQQAARLTAGRTHGPAG